MSHLIMDFSGGADNAAGTPYTLECLNQSSAPWYFYIYQTMPKQPKEVFSLAWIASPIKIDIGAKISFTWSIDYSFVWGISGALQPGVNYQASQAKTCELDGNNQTTFSVTDNKPSITNPVAGGQSGSLTINMSKDVPNLTYGTGIGMSGYGTFVQQALANAPQIYTPTPKYYVAGGTQIQMGVVLAETVLMSKEVTFGNSIYKMYATLDSNQEWKISQEPPKE